LPEAEYLIRPSSHEGWLVIPARFSLEDPGWEVIFDGDISHLNPDEIITQIAHQIQEATGIAAEWLRYT